MNSICVLWHTDVCPGKAMCARVCAQQKIRSRDITERSGPTEITQREKQKEKERDKDRDSQKQNIKNNIRKKDKETKGARERRR